MSRYCRVELGSDSQKMAEMVVLVLGGSFLCLAWQQMVSLGYDS